MEALLGLTHAEIKTHPLAGGLSKAKLQSTDDECDEYYLSAPKDGVSLVMDADKTVIAVQLYSKAHQGFSQFKRPLPCGVDFSMSQKALRALLGKPSKSGKAQTIEFLGDMPAWDKFSCKKFSLHAEYEFDSNSIRLITLAR